jgi:uncharacterized protein (TIGR03086 family)
MPIEMLVETQTAVRRVLRGVASDRLGSATPCKDWDLSALIDHVLSGQSLLLGFVAEVQPETVVASEDLDVVGRFDDGATRMLAVVSVPGFAERTLDLPIGPFTGAEFIDLVSLETLAHAWDVARATEQDTDLAPAAAEYLLGVAKERMKAPRAEGANFGPAQPAPEAAPPADRLAAFLGRSL